MEFDSKYFNYNSDDHTRVILTPVADDENDDYTNANYIDVSIYHPV